MTTWTPAELDRIAAADELEITTHRSDGRLRSWVPIWVVRVDDALYVRSWRGSDGAWYRHVSADGRARVRVADVERDVTTERVDDADTQAAIDDAYRGKYARYGDAYVQPMIADQARATTLRLTPHG